MSCSTKEPASRPNTLALRADHPLPMAGRADNRAPGPRCRSGMTSEHNPFRMRQRAIAWSSATLIVG
ncbi:hypothetical protein K523DRAFT_358599 [Schizophyllum commune Tattone D]|nr:hypothetical protein K523DRAFT_358599 [Schizophyllum commune Tattone D]